MSNRNNQKKGKKSIASSLGVLVLALLLLLGQQLGILPTIDSNGGDVSNLNTESTVYIPPEATEAPKATEAPAQKSGPIIEPQDIADYLFAHGELPDNFITKNEAKALGWDSSENYVSDVAPGKSIGGDRFGNYEGLLPKASGRTYYEADCYYTSGARNAHRIVYSSDGLVFYTDDHYETFTEMKPSR